MVRGPRSQGVVRTATESPYVPADWPGALQGAGSPARAHAGREPADAEVGARGRCADRRGAVVLALVDDRITKRLGREPRRRAARLARLQPVVERLVAQRGVRPVHLELQPLAVGGLELVEDAGDTGRVGKHRDDQLLMVFGHAWVSCRERGNCGISSSR